MTIEPTSAPTTAAPRERSPRRSAAARHAPARRAPLAGLAGLATAALGTAGLGLVPTGTAAWAASPPATAGALAVVAKVNLGPSSAAALDALTEAEAPDGTFYLAAGSAVSVVHGSTAPATLLHAPAKVLALGATASDLYVQTGLTVADYTLPALHIRRTWALTHPRATASPSPTSSGLLAAGGVVWSWDDWATDASGFQYATLDELAPTGQARLVDGNAFPADMAADATGLYYETEIGTKGYLAHVTPAGRRSLSASTADTDAPVALAGGSVILFAVHQPAGTPYIDRFSTATLAQQGSARQHEQLLTGQSTSAGLLAISCKQASCTTESIVELDPQDATTSGALTIPGLAVLVRASSPAVLAASGGDGWLERLGSAGAGAPGTPVLGAKTFHAPGGAGWGTVEPRAISNGGDPSGIVSDITWTGWGSADAYAYGKSSISKPGGGYYPLVKVELKANDLGHCSAGGPLAYQRLEVRVHSRPGGALGAWVAWGGAGSICTAGG